MIFWSNKKIMINIVEMSEKHIHDVYNVEINSFNKPWSLKSFQDELKNNAAKYFVAVVDGSVAGYIGMWKIAGQCDITNVAVLPEFRRKGVGKKLIEHLIQYCKNKHLSPIFLEVRKSNEPAKSLYTGFGFKEVGIRKKYYTDTGEDAIIMSL